MCKKYVTQFELVEMMESLYHWILMQFNNQFVKFIFSNLSSICIACYKKGWWREIGFFFVNSTDIFS